MQDSDRSRCDVKEALLEIENGQTELDEERTDGIEVDGSVNELDGEGEEKKEEDEGSDDHNWK